MILDKAENLNRYQLPQPAFSKLAAFVKTFDAADFQKGRFEIDGDDFFGIGLAYETKSSEDCLWEAHRKYIDVHYILEGEEIVHVNDISAMKVSKEFVVEHDYGLFEGKKRDALTLAAGDMLILYPNEVHRTSVKVEAPCAVKKIVFKLGTV